MKYLKVTILTLIILIIIIIALILSIMKGDKYVHIDEIEDTELNIKVERTISNLENTNNYYIVKKIIENYYYDLTQFNMKNENVLVLEVEEENENPGGLSNQVLESEIKAYKNKVYNYLASEYKEKNNITIDNIQEKLGNYNNVQVIINNVYYVDSNENVRIYFIYGNVIEKETREKEEFAIMLSLDSKNSAFEIYPSGYDYNIELGKELKIDIEEIKNIVYNSYKFNLTNDETFAKELFKDYQNRLMYDLDSAYEHLDEEYKTKKFENVQEFKEYINNNFYRFINANITKYQVEYFDDYKRIICTDSNENSYIFKVKEIANYLVIPDAYTIDTPEFNKKYNESNTQEKIVLNLNKFILALNDGDYKYAYSLLADSFKENNFKTQQEFENYIKSNFFDENKLDYEKYSNEAGTYYTYEVKITDKSGKSNQEITKTFIMLLGEGTDFELSFNL